jgi:hypothetical protein
LEKHCHLADRYNPPAAVVGKSGSKLANPASRGMVCLRKARAREIMSTVRWFVADRKCRHPLPAPAMAFEAVGTMVLSLFRGQYY